MMIVEKIINTAFIKRQLKKFEKAKREIAQIDAYDYIVYNYNGGSALAADDIKAIVRAEKLARHRQPDAEKKYFGIE
jgi:guanylate kinase